MESPQPQSCFISTIKQDAKEISQLLPSPTSARIAEVTNPLSRKYPDSHQFCINIFLAFRNKCNIKMLTYRLSLRNRLKKLLFCAIWRYQLAKNHRLIQQSAAK